MFKQEIHERAKFQLQETLDDEDSSELDQEEAVPFPNVSVPTSSCSFGPHLAINSVFLK